MVETTVETKALLSFLKGIDVTTNQGLIIIFIVFELWLFMMLIDFQILLEVNDNVNNSKLFDLYKFMVEYTLITFPIRANKSRHNKHRTAFVLWFSSPSLFNLSFSRAHYQSIFSLNKSFLRALWIYSDNEPQTNKLQSRHRRSIN